MCVSGGVCIHNAALTVRGSRDERGARMCEVMEAITRLDWITREGDSDP